MPDITFEVVAVTGTGREPVVWDIPAHVADVVAVPMWGPAPDGRPPAAAAAINSPLPTNSS